MSKRLFVIAVLVLTVGFFTRAFAYAEEVMQQPAVNLSESMTRAEAVALLINADAANLNRVRWFAGHMPPLPLFTDIDQKQWYAPYLEAAFEKGLIEGNKERLFHPNDALKEDEAIQLAIRYKQMTDPNAGVYLVIPTSQGSPLNKIVSEAQANDIKMPFPVRPGMAITRGSLYEMIASAGVQNPSTITIAQIPVTTQFITVASIQPILPQTVPSTATNPQIVPAVPETPGNTYFAISMPNIDINDLPISHPSDFSHDGLLAPLKTGVGHLFSYPGQGGKILVYGHSSSYPWDTSEYTKIFRKINKLAVGDKVYVNYHGVLYTYEVSFKQTVNASDTSAYAQEGKEELILYTCWPPDSVKQRYLVHAKLVTTVAAK